MAALDVVINNAGLGGEAPIVDMTDDQWNLRPRRHPQRHLPRACAPHCATCTSGGNGGVIVNNASVLGWRAQHGQAHYAAAKAGVMALTRCAAIEAAEHGVRVNAVAPSLAMHPFLAKVTSEDLLAELESARGLRPGRRAVGDRQRDGLPGLRSTRRT